MVFLSGTFNVGLNISDHFASASKMVPMPKGTEKEMEDYFFVFILLKPFSFQTFSYLCNQKSRIRLWMY